MRKLAKAISIAATEIFKDQGTSTSSHKTHAMTAVVAAMAAYRLPIPSSPVERPKEWYITNCLAAAENFIGGVNEHTVLDVRGALDIAQAVWESRYSIVHVPASKEAMASLMEIVGSGNYRVPPIYGDAIRSVGCGNFQELMVVAQNVQKGEMDFETSEA